MKKFDKRFTMGKVATGLYGRTPYVVGETCIIVSLIDPYRPGIKRLPNQHWGVNEKGEVFEATPTVEFEPEGFYFNSLRVNTENWDYVGQKVLDYPDEIDLQEVKEVAKKFRRQAEDTLRKGGFIALHAAQRIVNNHQFIHWDEL